MALSSEHILGPQVEFENLPVLPSPIPQITLTDLVEKLVSGEIARFELYKATPKLISMKVWVYNNETELSKVDEFMFYTNELDYCMNREAFVNSMFSKLLANLRRPHELA